MATLCHQCGGIISDIGSHPCPGRISKTIHSPYTPLPQPLKGQKCDICGSTAVDHTERQCALNRLSRQPKAKKAKHE